MNTDIILPADPFDITIISVSEVELDESTKNILAPHMTWMDIDDDLREHIYNVDFTEEELENPQIKTIWQACNKRNAAYVRLIEV